MPLNDVLRQRLQPLTSTVTSHRIILYGIFSTGAMLGAILNACRNQSNFYSVMVYLSRSGRSLLIMANFGSLFALLCGKIMQRIFFGPLQPREVERLYDQTWMFVTESLLAFTIFRDEFDIPFLLMFGFLLFVKCFHWLMADRVESMEQIPYPGPPFLYHLRMNSLFLVLSIVDLVMFGYAVESTLDNGVGGMVLFATEYAILMASALNAMARYSLNNLEYRRAATRGGENAAPWENKSMYVFYIELITDFLKLSTYLTFFMIILTFYGLPLNIIRDVYITARSFITRLRALIRYHNATRDMDRRYPNATEQELAAMSDRTCIICREELTTQTQGGGNEGGNEGENGQPQPNVQQDGPNMTPKKLPCGHVFHFQCLRSWLERQQSCPTCRRSVLETNQQNRNGQQQGQQAQQQQAGQGGPRVAMPQPGAAPQPGRPGQQGQQPNLGWLGRLLGIPGQGQAQPGPFNNNLAPVAPGAQPQQFQQQPFNPNIPHTWPMRNDLGGGVGAPGAPHQPNQVHQPVPPPPYGHAHGQQPYQYGYGYPPPYPYPPYLPQQLHPTPYMRGFQGPGGQFYQWPVDQLHALQTHLQPPATAQPTTQTQATSSDQSSSSTGTSTSTNPPNDQSQGRGQTDANPPRPSSAQSDDSDDTETTASDDSDTSAAQRQRLDARLAAAEAARRRFAALNNQTPPEATRPTPTTTEPSTTIGSQTTTTNEAAAPASDSSGAQSGSQPQATPSTTATSTTQSAPGPAPASDQNQNQQQLRINVPPYIPAPDLTTPRQPLNLPAGPQYNPMYRFLPGTHVRSSQPSFGPPPPPPPYSQRPQNPATASSSTSTSNSRAPLNLNSLPSTLTDEQLARMDSLTREAIDERIRVLEGVATTVHRCVEELTRVRSVLPVPAQVALGTLGTGTRTGAGTGAVVTPPAVNVTSPLAPPAPAPTTITTTATAESVSMPVSVPVAVDVEGATTSAIPTPSGLGVSEGTSEVRRRPIGEGNGDANRDGDADEQSVPPVRDV